MKRLIYQILPRLWGDSTLDSINERTLDYLASLGMDFVWLTGIPRHATGKDFVKGNPGSPYAVSDWYDVNHYLAKDGYSSMDAFDQTVKRIHSKGIGLLIDFIPNHVAKDYTGSIANCGRCDWDWTDTLKADYCNLETEAEMIRVLKFWCSKGVDGFRCDMVELVPRDAMHRILTAVRAEYPDTVFVAEVYVKQNYNEYINEVGFDLLYDKSGMYDILRGILSGRNSARELTWNWQFLSGLQPNMLNFLENHDEQRLASPWFAGDVSKVWAILAMSLLFNTASFMLYFGQEVGENASEGDSGRTSIFNWCHPKGVEHLHSFVQTGRGMTSTERNVLSRYKRLLKLSKRPAFSEGCTWDLCYCNLDSPGFNPETHFAFLRYDEKETWLVFCNMSDSDADVLISIPDEISHLCSETSYRLSVPSHDAIANHLEKPEK